MRPHSFKCGKLIPKQHYNLCVFCFNEAALFQVRKGGKATTAPIIDFFASMRPHSFKCGKMIYATALFLG